MTIKKILKGSSLAILSTLILLPTLSSAASNFRDDFNGGYRSDIWSARWGSNGTPFGCEFAGNKIAKNSYGITLQADANKCAELQSKGYYHYGTFQGSLITGSTPGTVSSIFTYTSQWDAAGRPWQEIDIEFLPSRGNVVHTNVIYKPVNGSYQSWEQDVDLGQFGLNIEQNLVTIGFDWSSWKIEWFVYDHRGNYQVVRKVYKDNGDGYVAPNEIPGYAWPKDPSKLMINHWNGDNSNDALYFPGYHNGAGSWAYYDYLEYRSH
jgi:beta-glucanase (GH16 family)